MLPSEQFVTFELAVIMFRVPNVVLCAVVLGSFTSIAPAVAFIPSDTVLTGMSGVANVGERNAFALSNVFSPGQDGLAVLDVQYLLDVLGSNQVHSLVVSTNSPFASAGTNRLGWYGFTEANSNWDSGINWIIGGSEQEAGVLVSSVQLGSFSSLFGGDSGVVIFGRGEDGSPVTDADDEDQADWGSIFATQFYLSNAVATSEFIAIGANGQIIEGSLFTAVPEPSAYLFGGLATAFAGAGFWLRRKS